MTTTTTQQPRHAAASFLPIYAATRAQHALQQRSGPTDGDALAAARGMISTTVDPQLWALVAEHDAQGSTRHEARTATITVPPLPSFEEKKRWGLAAVLRRWWGITNLTQLALAEPRVESPTSEVAR